MFGRRGADNNKNVPPVPPAPPQWPPAAKMDAALDAAIRLYTEALESAGKDCGGLAIRGPVPKSVARLLADCVSYEGRNGTEYLTLGLTPDFKAFSYQPHCRLFLMVNSALLMEDPIPAELRAQIAVGQVPRSLVDAHMMRRWVKHIHAVGTAAAAGDGPRLKAIVQSIVAETMDVARQTPSWIAERVNLRECVQEWCHGFPGAIGRPLSAEVKRMNDLPVTEFVEKMLTDFLVEQQMQGLEENRRARGR